MYYARRMEQIAPKTLEAWRRDVAPIVCSYCGGKCHRKDNKEQQKSFHETYKGITMPSECIIGSDGADHCPYAS